MKYVLISLIMVLLWPGVAAAKGDLISLTNNLRVKQGLERFEIDVTLNEIARRRAEHIIGSQSFSHNEWRNVFKGQGFCIYGENLAVYYKRDSQIMRGWKKSPTHYQNLILPYTHVGVAKVNGKLNGYKTDVVVMTFGIKC